MKCTDVYDHNRWHFSKGTDSRKNVGVRKNDLSKIGTKLISSRTLLIVIEIRKESLCDFIFFFFCQQNTCLVKNYIVSKNCKET